MTQFLWSLPWITNFKNGFSASKLGWLLKKCNVCHRICYPIIHSWFESLFFLKVLFKNVFPEVFEPVREMHGVLVQASQQKDQGDGWSPVSFAEGSGTAHCLRSSPLVSVPWVKFSLLGIFRQEWYTLGHPMPSQYFSSLSEPQNHPKRACENMFTLAPPWGFLIQ